MKRIKILLILAISALTFNSCSDAIDIVQAGELTDATIFTSTTDLQNYLDGAVYGSLDVTNEVFISSLLTDELKIGPANAGQQQGDFRFIIASNNVYANAIWFGNYTTINRVNRLLRAAEGITPATGDVTRYNNILAQARALRAFAYLRLETYFSTDMKNDGALGVIPSTTVPEIDNQTPRATNAAIWTIIEADIAFAEANLATSSTGITPAPFNINTQFYVGRAMVSAMKARMYLYRGKYPQAQTAAQDAITQSGLALTTAGTTNPAGSAALQSAFYASPSSSPYRNLWNDTQRGEKIFSLSRPEGGPGGNIAGVYTTNNTTLSGSPWWVVGLNLYSQLVSYPSDIRRFNITDPSSVANTYVIDKYPGKGTQVLKNDHKIFRISEMKLIIAEVEARKGTAAGYTAAATAIKEIRDARRFTGTVGLPTYTTVAGALADILKERRVELAFEGHRYIDLKRAGAEAGVSIDRNAGDDIFISSTPITLPITDNRFTLPIPAAEFNGNPAIAGQQNPGY